MMADRAFVLGLDGVPWDLLERWAEDGELPNFQRLLTEGASGPLESTIPATTAPAWPAIATGVGPDKHGVYGFQRIGTDYRHRMNTSHDWCATPMWERLAPSVVGNVPLTYPAREIDGTLVTGMMTPEPGDGFTHPRELAAEIADRVPHYAIGLDWGEYADRQQAFLDDLDGLLTNRVELLELLMTIEDWELFFFVFTALDRLKHLVWDESVILDHYRTMDDVLGDVLDYVADRGATLYVVSDHGFGPISRIVHVNRLLESAGYLTRQRESGTRGVLSSLGVTKSNVETWLDRSGISQDALVDYLPQAFVDMVALQVPGEHSLYDVEFGETTAFFHGSGELYVNDTERFERGTVRPEAVPALKRELTSLLETAEDPETGDRPLTVHDGGEVYPADDESPDLVVTPDPAYDCLTMLTDKAFSDPGSKAGGHRSEGVFLAWGPDVEAGATVEEASVVDVAPTVLHGAGEAIPEATDGRVLQEVFTDGSAPGSTPVEKRPLTARADDSRDPATEDGDDGDVEERLRGLGYLE